MLLYLARIEMIPWLCYTCIHDESGGDNVSFSDRLKYLYENMGATSAALARYAECAPSNFSRLYAGSRLPKPGSPTMNKLLDGIYLYADSINALSALCSVYGGCPGETSDIIKTRLQSWLFQDEPEFIPAKSLKTKKHPSTPFLRFGDKLNAVMNLLDLSNIRLSKAVKLDPSNISRFRNGMRTPKSNPQLTEFLCTKLMERVTEQKKEKDLLQLMNLPLSDDIDSDTLSLAFYQWLCDFGSQTESDTIDRLLEHIDAFSPESKVVLPDFPSIAAQASRQEPRSLYYGFSGLQEAVIRFLVNAAAEKVPELWLYSDQGMEWLFGNQEFLLIWMSLMGECIRRQVKIKIIHNIDRNLSEMVSAIGNWMPLYMSGMIEPYFCRKKADGRFSHTLFLCPGNSCIKACHVTGCEADGWYSYITEEAQLSLLSKEFDCLLSVSEPLLRVYPDCGFNSLQLASGSGGSFTSLTNTLSVATMPESLIQSFCKRLKLTQEEAALLHRTWRKQRNDFLSQIENGTVTELVPAVDDNLLFQGTVFTEFDSSTCSQSITYTAEEYTMHISNIIKLFETYPDYRLYSLPESPFTNIALYLSSEYAVVVKTSAPTISFVFTHTFMIHAFDEYINRIKEQYRIDRNTLRHDLMRYL